VPSIDEIKRTILEADRDDWKFIDGPQEYVYRPDPRIHILQEDYGDERAFSDKRRMSPEHEPWLNRYHHADSVYQRRFWVRFNDTRIDHKDVLWIDEGNLELPIPRREVENSPPEDRSDYGEISINRYEAGFARIMSGERLDYMLSQADIEVRDSDFN